MSLLLTILIAIAVSAIMVGGAAAYGVRALRRWKRGFQAEIEAAYRAKIEERIGIYKKQVEREFAAARRAEENIGHMLDGINTAALHALDRVRALESKDS